MTSTGEQVGAVLFAILVTSAMFVGFVTVPTGTASASSPPFAGGDGSADNPYEIADWEQLNNTRSYLGENFVLLNDLNASTNGYDSVANGSANGGAGFVPIGDSDNRFTGSFDGAGYTIEDLVLNRSGETGVGLFGYADSNAEIVNATLHNLNVTGKAEVGGLVGNSQSTVTVRASHMMGSVNGTDRNVGGLIGISRGLVENSTATVDVNATFQNVGGLVGTNYGIIRNSTARGNVSGGSTAGGLVGLNSGLFGGGTVELSSAHGAVDGTSRVGGLVGQNTAGDSAVITRSYATGNATGASIDQGVGGLVGFVFSGVVNRSYATGVVSGTGSGGFGGLVGKQSGGSIDETYSTGLIDTTAGTTGGLVGKVNGGTASNSYWDTSTSKKDTSANGSGLTTAEMTGSDALTSLSGFDASVWQTNSGGTGGTVQYPTLQANLQTPPPGVTPEPGTEANPYQIANWTELNDIRNDLGANYTLVNDLNASTDGYDSVANGSANGGAGFEPIGNTSNTKFTGSFDGAGYTIGDLVINRTNQEYVGLFGYAGSNAEISDVALHSVNITGNEDVGGLVGNVAEGATVRSSHVAGTVIGSGSEVGGLVGYSEGVVETSTATVDVDATDFVGGLVGYTSGSVRNSSATEAVTGSIYVGGLIGGSSAAAVSNSTATGSVSGKTYVAGLVGYNGGGTVDRSSAHGVIDGRDDVGGLVGTNKAASSVITRSYATGNVTVELSGAEHSAGGLVGEVEAGTVNRSYATGVVSGPSTGRYGGLVGNHIGGSIDETYSNGFVNSTSGQTGGLIGTQDSLATVSHSYWDTVISKQSTSGGDAVGLTAAEMTGSDALTSLSGFNASVWQANSGGTPGTVQYPTLQANAQTPPPEAPAPPGTEGNPYAVANWTDLNDIQNDLDASYVLTADLNASTDGYDTVANASANGNDGFDPIGNKTAGTAFDGSFDGNGHTISDVTIDRPTQDTVGLFGYVNGSGTLSNLSLANVSVSGDHAVGGLVGQYNSSEPLTDFSVGGTVDASGNSSGGLVGILEDGNVTNTTADVDVSGRFRTGGLIGYASVLNPKDSTISDSVANGDVDSQSGPAGGLIGKMAGDLVVVSDSRATGNVTVQPGTLSSGHPATGGAIGYMAKGNGVENVSASGTVDGNNRVGGLVGDVGSNGNKILNSSATGNVTGNDQVGGLVGSSNRFVLLSYATGDVYGSNQVGGLVGVNNNKITASYATGSVDGDQNVGGLVGFTASGGGAGVQRSYAVGQVAGSNTVGGLVGAGARGGATITSSYWDTEASGQSESAGSATGLTTDQMTGDSAKSSMSDLNFDVVWDVDDGSFVSYPFLTSNPQDPAPGKTAVSSGGNSNPGGNSDGSSGGSGGGSNTADRGSTVTVEPEPDAGEETATSESDTETTDSKSVAVRGVRQGEQVRIDLSETATESDVENGPTEGADDSGNSEEGSEATEESEQRPRNVLPDGLDITFKQDGDYDLDVSSRDVDIFTRTPAEGSDDESDTSTSTPDLSTNALDDDSKRFVSETKQRPVGFIEVDTQFESSEVVEEATHRFRVRKSYLESTSASVDSVTLYRDEADGWQSLPTRQTNEDEEFYYFEGDTPGFSVFAIGTSSAVFETSMASLDSFDETSGAVETSISVENVGSQTGEFTVSLTADGTVVETATVTVAADETVDATVSGTIESTESVALRLAGQSIGDVTSTEPAPVSSNAGMIGLIIGLVVVLAGILVWRRRGTEEEK